MYVVWIPHKWSVSEKKKKEDSQFRQKIQVFNIQKLVK